MGFLFLKMKSVNSVWRLSLNPGFELSVGAGERVKVGQVIAKKGKRKVRSMVGGLVEEVDKRRLSISFKAKRIEGEGIGKKRAWGKLVVLLGSDSPRNQLTIDFQGKVILVEELTPSLLAKAKALGVKGVVGFSVDFSPKKSTIKTLAVLHLGKRGLGGRLSWWKKMEGRMCLVDAQNGQLLIGEDFD